MRGGDMHRIILAITLLFVACVDDTEPSNAPLALIPGDSNSRRQEVRFLLGENAQGPNCRLKRNLK